MRLSRAELGQIREALRQAFPAAVEELSLVVSDADIGIDFAEYAGDYPIRIQKLLEQAVGKYRLTKLLDVAVRAAPENPQLSEIAEFVNRYFLFLPRSRDTALGDAERVLFKNSGFQNVREWLEKLKDLSHIVCRIEPQPRKEGLGGYGTGFLVGPNVVMTNDHVASGFWGSADRASRVRIRFDCIYTPDGKSAEGTEHRLASQFEIIRGAGSQLDFALLKLDDRSGPPSEDIIDGKRRGFVVPVAHTFEDSEPLLILQHPQAEPMKLAFGSLSAKSKWRAEHIDYLVNTDGGSSGSPCLTSKLEVAAIHNQGSNSHNSGVLISAILAECLKPANRSLLLDAGLHHLIGEMERHPPSLLRSPSASTPTTQDQVPTLTSAPTAEAQTPAETPTISNPHELRQSRKKFLSVRLPAEDWLRSGKPQPPYFDAHDATDDSAARIPKSLNAHLWLPSSEYLATSPFQEYTPLACVISPGTDAVVTTLQTAIPFGIELPPNKVRNEDKVKIYATLASAFADSFIAAITLPKLMLNVGRNRPELAYQAMLNLFLLPLLEMHRLMHVERMNLYFAPLGACTKPVVAIAKRMAKGVYMRGGFATADVAPSQSLIVIQAIRFIAWAVGASHNSNNDTWISLLEKLLNANETGPAHGERPVSTTPHTITSDATTTSLADPAK